MRDSKLGQPTDRRRLEEKNRGEEMGTGKALRAKVGLSVSLTIIIKRREGEDPETDRRRKNEQHGVD